MDPKANIEEQISIAREIQRIVDECSEDGVQTENQAREIAENAERLADLVLALDEWRRKGGFDPY